MQQRQMMEDTTRDTTASEDPLVMEILGEASSKYFLPLFRGTVPLMGHSMASAILGLVGQPRLQKWVQKEVGAFQESCLADLAAAEPAIKKAEAALELWRQWCEK